MTPDDLRKWGSTVLGLVILAGNLILFFAHVWHGENNRMGYSEWGGFFALLALGALLLGYKFNPLDFLPSWVRRKG